MSSTRASSVSTFGQKPTWTRAGPWDAFPLVVNPLRLLLSGKPFIENYEWKPGQGTRFILIDKKDGSARSYNAEAFFAFHHVNAFEEKGEVFVDIAAYRDPEIITALYLENLQAGKPIPPTELRRYRLPAQGKAADFELLSSEPLELPRLNYKRHNGKAYRYAYGVGVRRAGGFADQLVKVDVRERTAKLWWEENSYPGEPVFIARPGAVAEDDGVILSVALDTVKGTSFLLVLDAASFTELARAEVPHHIPFGLHGQFFEK